MPSNTYFYKPSNQNFEDTGLKNFCPLKGFPNINYKKCLYLSHAIPLNPFRILCHICAKSKMEKQFPDTSDKEMTLTM